MNKGLYYTIRTTIYILGLDNIRKTRCVLSLIYLINKMYAILASLKKKPGIKLKYKVRNSKKSKLSNKKQKNIVAYLDF
jgi:hypothetical protein